MTDVPAAAPGVRHGALGPPGGVLLEGASVGDRARLALVLDAASLLAALRSAGLGLADPWRDLRLDGQGLRITEPVAAAPARRGDDELLLELLDRLWPPNAGSRGEGRRVARRLRRRWSESPVRRTARRAVEDLLDGASFLWGPGAAAARRRLVAEVRPSPHAPWRPVLAVPPAFARAVHRRLGANASAARLSDWLASGEARDVWLARHVGVDTPEGDAAARLASLVRAGRFEAAQAALETAPCDAGGPVARAAWAVVVADGRGDFAAVREHGRRLADIAGGLAAPPWLLEEAVGVAVRREAPYGRRATLALAESLAPCLPPAAVERLRASLRDLGAPGAAERAAAEAPGPGGAGSPSGRTGSRPARALAAVERARQALALASLGRARRESRRALLLAAHCDPAAPVIAEAARLEAEALVRWGRIEEACRLWGTDLTDPGRAGEEGGAEERAWRWRIAARALLQQGRSAAALAAARRALSVARAGAPAARSADLLEAAALEVRALCDLGPSEDLAQAVEALGPEGLRQLTAEERPLALALAGARDAAFAAAGTAPWGALWRAALVGETPAAEAWACLRDLDRFVAARLMVDLDRVAPGCGPLYWRRRAAAELRRRGAGPLAERLEGVGLAPWRALERYLAEATGDATALAALFVRAGYSDAWLAIEGEAGVEQVLVAGPGGPEELAAPVPGGRLRLRAPLLDSVVRALFLLLVRDLHGAGRIEAAPGGAGARGGDAPAPRPPGFEALFGASAALHAALERAAAFAPSDMPVLILGETGTGKELVARGLHRGSRRAAAAMLPVNCAALSESLLLSDLFGHARGAFTGADRERAGVFESARGGTVFLDEIGDLPAAAQGMLLRVLQEGEVRRLGESVARRVDVRIVAATHRDLRQEVRRGRFRQDLFFRLALAVVELPPLRRRGDDVLLLADRFLARARPGLPAGGSLAPSARRLLRRHDWPGNVRELENALEVGLALAGGRPVEARHLPLPAESPAASRGDERSAAGSAGGEIAGDYHRAVEEFRLGLVREAIRGAGGNLAAAARRLGLTRQALSYLARRLEGSSREPM